jgi:hypothetical protein
MNMYSSQQDDPIFLKITAIPPESRVGMYYVACQNKSEIQIVLMRSRLVNDFILENMLILAIHE